MHQSIAMDRDFELQKKNLEQSNGHMSIKLRSKSFMILLYFNTYCRLGVMQSTKMDYHEGVGQ